MEPSGPEIPACCDPAKRHKKRITKNLRAITELDVSNNPELHLVVGAFWCDNCRKSQPCSSRSTDDSVTPAVPPSETVSAPIPCCCDPGNKHKQPVTKNLRKMTSFKDAGKVYYLCDSCRRSIDCSNIVVPQTVEKIEKEEEISDCTCCNPFDLHKKPIQRALRVIQADDLKKFPDLIVGQFWCDRCRKMPAPQGEPSGMPIQGEETLSDSGLSNFFIELAGDLAKKNPCSQEVASTQTSGTSGSPNLSPAVLKEDAARCLFKLGLSPVETTARSKMGVITAAKRKIDEATELVRKKVCRAAGIGPEDLETPEARKARDQDLLLEEIKRKLSSASRHQKYQLLSLVPLSMSLSSAQQYFGVSRHLLRTARELKIKEGILPKTDFTRTSSVAESTKLLVREFYCLDENSKVLPGVKDCVSVSKGVYEQKRLILSNLSELYNDFKRTHENLKVGISMFFSLRPKWCIFAGGAGTHEQCVCQIHQNFKLITHALNIKMHYFDLIKMCVCDVKNRECMLRHCENCPKLEAVQEKIRQQIEVESEDIFDENEESEFLEAEVKFRQWKSTDRTEMIVQICKRSELLATAAKHLNDLIPHDFISRSQNQYIKELKENLPPNKAVINMDFSMNYNCLIQSAVQSYHWSPKQATVHPTVIYYKDSENLLQRKSLMFISDDLDHDVPLVRKFQERTSNYLKENLPQINEVEYVTDGCSSQYKSKGYFKMLANHEKEFGLKASHSYYATSHGKSQCDADGGSAKRKARRASLQRPFDEQIIDAQDLFKFCVQEMKDKFIFLFVTKAEVEPERKQYKLMLDTLKTVPGTRSFHHIKPRPGDAVACWRISSDQTKAPSLVHSLQKEAAEDPMPCTLSHGMFVVARVASNRYIGMVTDTFEEDQSADLSLLMPRLPSKTFRWPQELRTACVPFPHILCEVKLTGEETVSFTPEDLENLYKKKILKRPSL